GGGAWVVSAVLVLRGVSAFGLVAGRLVPAGSAVVARWPPAGLAVGFLAVTPPRLRPAFLVGLVLAASVAGAAGGRDPLLLVALSLANAVEAGLVIALLTRAGTTGVRLRSLEDLWRFLAATVVGVVVVGVLAGFAVVLMADQGDFGETFRAVAAAHAASILLIAPLGMDVGAPGVRRSRPEIAAHVLVVVSGVALTFAPAQALPLVFLPVPLLVWSAMRMPLRVVSVELALAGGIASLLTSVGAGPIAEDQIRDQLGTATTTAVLQAYLVVLALVALPLTLANQQRREALAMARAGESLFRRSFSDSLIGMVLLRDSPAGLLVEEVNRRGAQLLGSTEHALLGRPWQQALPASERDRFETAAGRVLAGEEPGWLEGVSLRGGDTWARVAVSPLARPGEERMLTLQLVDLTGERQAQRSLVAERDFTAAVLDSTAMLVVVVDRDGRVARYNAGAERLSGLLADEVRGRPVEVVLGTALAGRVRRALSGHARRPEEAAEAFEEDWPTRHGDRHTVAWSCAFLDHADRESPLVMTGVDVTEQRAAQSLFRDVVGATTGTSIIGTDKHGTVTFFNPGAENLLGWTAEEVVGKATPELFHDPSEMAARAAAHPDGTTFGLLVEGVSPGTAGPKRDWRYVRKDGTPIVMSLTVSAITDGSGRVVGYLGVAEDVTERARAEAVLRDALAREREAVERLNEVDRSKTDFVSSVSHELRTPITSVLGYTQLLQRGSGGPLSDRQADLLRRVESNGLRLQALIEDLLTLSRIEAGTFEMSTARVGLGRVLRRAAEAADGLRHDRDLRWRLDEGPEPLTVEGDEDQLDRAVLNLLSNAIKFTPDGGAVAVSMRPDHDTGEAVVEVCDTGIGIRREEQHQLFTRFFRSSSAQQRAIPGTGLGLSIVRSIVEGHQGTVRVTSDADEGTTVEVRLPLVPASPSAPPGRGPGG
ncbi:MAG: PAS domain S-box protein, partial [Nocardioidaceae bacterium]|nr:PAS domain S-box protein [Nocardioidaceae bacterium]